MPEAVRDTLLKASTMIYLFRAMTAAEAAAQKREVELHLISLVNDVSGTDRGFVVLRANAIFRGLRPLSSADAPEVLCIRTN